MATVKKRGSSYLIRVYAGYDATGKQIEKTKTWTPPSGMTERQAEKEAQLQAALFEDKVRSGLVCDRKIRLMDFAEIWFTYAEPGRRPRTIARYRELMGRITPVLGHLWLDQIRPTHLLEFYKELSATEPVNATYCCTCDLRKRLKDMKITQVAFSKLHSVSLTTLATAWHRDPISRSSAEKISHGLGVELNAIFQPTDPCKTLSSTTVLHHHSLIAKMLHDAVRWGYIPYNPADRVDAPKAAQHKILYLDDIQSKQLVELLRRQPGKYGRPSILLLLTGLRRGELLGLEWQDINFEEKTARISRTSQYLPERGVYTDSTKNSSSNRTVKISNQVISILHEQYLWQQRKKKLLGNAWIDSDRIVTTENGEPMRPDLLSAWFGDFIEGTDLPDIHLHSLRHTYASLCIANGIPLTAVAAQLGHANIATTAKIYAHVIESTQVAASNIIGDLLVGSL